MFSSYFDPGVITAAFFGNGRTPTPTTDITQLPVGSGEDAMSVMLSAGLYKFLTIAMALIAVGIFASWAWSRFRG